MPIFCSAPCVPHVCPMCVPRAPPVCTPRVPALIPPAHRPKREPTLLLSCRRLRRGTQCGNLAGLLKNTAHLHVKPLGQRGQCGECKRANDAHVGSCLLHLALDCHLAFLHLWHKWKYAAPLHHNQEMFSQDSHLARISGVFSCAGKWSPQGQNDGPERWPSSHGAGAVGVWALGSG